MARRPRSFFGGVGKFMPAFGGGGSQGQAASASLLKTFLQGKWGSLSHLTSGHPWQGRRRKGRASLFFCLPYPKESQRWPPSLFPFRILPPETRLVGCSEPPFKVKALIGQACLNLSSPFDKKINPGPSSILVIFSGKCRGFFPLFLFPFFLSET